MATTQNTFSLRIFIYRWQLQKKIIIFGADKSSSAHVNNKRESIFIFGEGPTKVLDDTLTAEGNYPINFRQSRKRFLLSQQYNGNHSFSFFNATKVYQFKAKNSDTKFTVFRKYFKRFYDQ